MLGISILKHKKIVHPFMESWVKLLLHGVDYVWLKIFHWPYTCLYIVQSKWFRNELTWLVAWPLHSRGDVGAHRKKSKLKKGISLIIKMESANQLAILKSPIISN